MGSAKYSYDADGKAVYRLDNNGAVLENHSWIPCRWVDGVRCDGAKCYFSPDDALVVAQNLSEPIN